MLKEQKIENNSPEAIAYRNMHRPRVDRLFAIKYSKKKRKDRKRLDFAARQLWRKIIKKSNEMKT